MSDAEHEGERPQPAPAKPRHAAAPTLRGWLKELAIVLVGALIVSTLTRAFVAQMFVIPSGSMENTLAVGDRVIVQKMFEFKRGDIVVFRDPAGWLDIPPPAQGPLDDVLVFIGLKPDESTNYLIKRVIGLPGDRVACCDKQGRLTVNASAIDESSYLYSDEFGNALPSDFAFDVTVPTDRVFVMGDHRNASRDSRCHLSDVTPGQPVGSAAFVPRTAVLGTAVAVVFPFSHWHTFATPEAFAHVPQGDPAPAQAVISPAGINC